jgi:uncharacterized protein YecE (DUF72 family)
MGSLDVVNRPAAGTAWHPAGFQAMRAFVGTAGWSVPAPYRDRFPQAGSQLARYAALLRAVEIDSSFLRPHQRKTYARWAASVPPAFRFSVKVPRAMTHGPEHPGLSAARFLDEVAGLENKLAVLLAQLPPSRAYDAVWARALFDALAPAGARIACEPRHASWFTPQADAALKAQGVLRVAADPPRADGGGRPGGATDLAYWRLHGSPRTYYSDYSEEQLESVAARLRPGDWCIFDNTAALHAMGNALYLAGRIGP